MLYRTNLHRVVSELTPMAFDKGPDQEQKSWNRFYANLKMARKMGLTAFLSKKGESYRSLCQRFTATINPIVPITQIIISDDLEEIKESSFN